MPAAAQAPSPDRPGATTTRVEGRIVDARNERPLASANIVVAGRRVGTISQPDGTYFLEGLEPGAHVLVITYIGYEEASREIDLAPADTLELDFALERTVAAVLDAIEIRAERQAIDVKSTSSSRTLLSQELETLIAQSPTLDEVVAQQPGVTREEGRLHFRGGRADESLFLIDGIGIRDVLSGDSDGSDLSAKSASRVNVVTGGMSARYGQAMSGVIDAQIKEGSRRWQGSASYETDLIADARNVHQLHFEIEGPNAPVQRLLRLLGSERPRVTFYASLGFDFTDAFNRYVNDDNGVSTLRSSVRDEIFGQSFRYGSFFYPNADNRWRGILKTTWRATPSDKFTVTLNKNLNFGHDWGRADIGDIDRNTSSFPWVWAKNLDGHYTISRDFNLLSLAWNRTLGLNTQTSLRLWRQYNGQHKDVFGKHYTEYLDLRDTDLSEDSTFVNTPYFIDVGDAPDWRDRYAVIWGLKNEWSYKLRNHNFEAGFSLEYQDVQYMQLNALSVYIDPANPNNSRPLGDEFDLFHVTPTVGDFYLQDRFEHEGLTVSLGLLYDYWFPGRQVEKALASSDLPHMTDALREKFLAETRSAFGYRFKGHLSPRVGISFPISDRSHLFFNYGHNSQRPPYYYVYAKSSSQSGEEYPRIGNPTLNPKISVSYEIGTGYEFSPSTAAKATLFWKDMYDYPTTIRLEMKERTTSRSNFFMYWNMDYARSRGIELSVTRNRRNFVSGSLSYTYSVSKGKASDPNKSKLIQETGGDSRETRLGEEFLWWNRPHKLTAATTLLIKEREDPPRWLGFRWPGDLSLGAFFMIRSGRPYTPENLAGQPVGAPYSANGPFDMTFDVSLTKGLRLGGRRFELSFKVYNVFDYRSPYYFDYVTGKPYEPGKGALSQGFGNPGNYDEALLDAYVNEYGFDSLDELTTQYYDEHGVQPDNWELIDLYRDYAADPQAIEQGVDNQFQAAAHAIQNPAYYGPPRTFRVGISYDW